MENTFNQALNAFFNVYTPDSTYSLTFQLFQFWMVNGCKAKIASEEVALFIDQLNSLVAAAFIVHQENRAQIALQKGNSGD